MERKTMFQMFPFKPTRIIHAKFKLHTFRYRNSNILAMRSLSFVTLIKYIKINLAESKTVILYILHYIP